jgi:hypothetical protein
VAELGICLDEILNNTHRWLLGSIIAKAVVDLETRQVEIELRVITCAPRGPGAASMPLSGNRNHPEPPHLRHSASEFARCHLPGERTRL